MSSSEQETPVAAEFFSARSRTPSIESQASTLAVSLAPIGEEDGKQTIGVSSNIHREFKDKRIYVNPRTGLPIKPPSSFGLFMHAMRRGMKDGKVTFSDFHRKATQKWMKMNEQEKEPYVERSKVLTEQYKKIEALYLRKKVRQLENQVKEYRQSMNSRGDVASGSRAGSSDIRGFRRYRR